MDTRAAAVTVRSVDAEREVVGSIAVIVAVPRAVAATSPLVPAALETVAAPLADDQVTTAVTSRVDASL
jgi:hypothetical protein